MTRIETDRDDAGRQPPTPCIHSLDRVWTSPWSTNANHIYTLFLDARKQEIALEGRYVSGAVKILHPRLRVQWWKVPFRSSGSSDLS